MRIYFQYSYTGSSLWSVTAPVVPREGDKLRHIARGVSKEYKVKELYFVCVEGTPPENAECGMHAVVIVE